MSDYTQYIPQTNSTTYPTSINNCFTALTADVTALETDKLNISGGAMTGLITNFESTGIDDNASATALVINAAGVATFNGNVIVTGSSTLGSITTRNDGIDQTLTVWNSDLGVNDTSVSFKSPTYDSTIPPFRWVTNNAFQWEIGGTKTLTLDNAGDAEFFGELKVAAYVVATKGASLTSGNIVSADINGRLTTSSGAQIANILLDYSNETITGNYTFNGIPNFNGGFSGSLPPFYVDSTQVVLNLNAELLDGAQGNLYARLASPTFSGTPYLPTGTTAVTKTAGNNSTALATTAYIDNIISSGTWTPSLQDISQSDAEGQVHTAQYGSYTKIGNRVLFSCRIAMSSLGSLSGTTLYIAGLPYTSSSTGSSVSSVSVIGSNLSITAGHSLAALIQLNATHIKLQIWDATTGNTNLGISDISATTDLTITGSYVTNV